VNGKNWTSSYSNSGRLLIQQSPLGRQSSATLDAKGRVTLVHQPAVADTTIGYDTRGRVQQLAQGPRTTTFAYDGADRVRSITDPLHRTVSFTYDAVVLLAER
jgi:YD repeat-containing protein